MAKHIQLKSILSNSDKNIRWGNVNEKTTTL